MIETPSVIFSSFMWLISLILIYSLFNAFYYFKTIFSMIVYAISKYIFN